MPMRRNMMMLAALALAGTVIGTAAQAGQWVYVPDGANAPRGYERGRTYAAQNYVPAKRRVYRQAPGTSSEVYIAPGAAFADNCTYRRERGLFGGWTEMRHCPD